MIDGADRGTAATRPEAETGGQGEAAVRQDPYRALAPGAGF